MEREDVADLLLATDKRAEQLDKVRLPEKPVQHSRLAFNSITDEDLLLKANGIVGSVLPCETCVCPPKTVLWMVSLR